MSLQSSASLSQPRFALARTEPRRLYGASHYEVLAMYLTPDKISYGRREFVRSIALDIILTLLTCGIWNLVVQYRQMQAMNYFLNVHRYSFLAWLIFTLLTCGLYHFYHEYRMSQDLQIIAPVAGEAQMPIVHLLLSVFGLSIVTDALQQSHINRMLGDESL